MNKKLLKQQVDDVRSTQLFSSSRSCKISAWRQFRKQVKAEIKTSKTPPLFPKGLSTINSPKKTSPISEVRAFISKVFKPITPEINLSIEYLSEIPPKDENPTISLKNTQLADILPIENIAILREILKTSNLDDRYKAELLLLSEDIQNLKEKEKFSEY